MAGASWAQSSWVASSWVTAVFARIVTGIKAGLATFGLAAGLGDTAGISAGLDDHDHGAG